MKDVNFFNIFGMNIKYRRADYVAMFKDPDITDSLVQYDETTGITTVDIRASKDYAK